MGTIISVTMITILGIAIGVFAYYKNNGAHTHDVAMDPVYDYIDMDDGSTFPIKHSLETATNTAYGTK